MKLISEIFDEIKQRESKEDKIAVLRYNSSWALRNVLKGTFDPNIKFVINWIPSSYVPNDAPNGLGYTTIAQELDRAYLFELGNPKVSPSLTLERKEQLLVQILEALEKTEADVYMNMILKDQKVEGLTYEVVKEAFPDLLP